MGSTSPSENTPLLSSKRAWVLEFKDRQDLNTHEEPQMYLEAYWAALRASRRKQLEGLQGNSIIKGNRAELKYVAPWFSSASKIDDLSEKVRNINAPMRTCDSPRRRLTAGEAAHRYRSVLDLSIG